jgi:hypothetical protein
MLCWSLIGGLLLALVVFLVVVVALLLLLGAIAQKLGIIEVPWTLIRQALVGSTPPALYSSLLEGSLSGRLKPVKVEVGSR